MSTSPTIPISYKNVSREAVPPFACVQLSGDGVQNGTTGARSVSVNKPDGTGPYAIDVGTGADSSSDGQYCLCVIPISHTWWVKYNGGAAPAEAWVTEVGPVSGQWYMDTTGSGYLYAGAFDSTNGLILVMQKPSSGSGKPIVAFEITDPDCDQATALATVLAVTDGASSPSVGDEIQVCDVLGCFFNTTNTLLNGRKGFAQQMRGLSCHRQSTGTGTGTGTGTVLNPWVVFSLCYPDVEC